MKSMSKTTEANRSAKKLEEHERDSDCNETVRQIKIRRAEAFMETYRDSERNETQRNSKRFGVQHNSKNNHETRSATKFEDKGSDSECK